jgi:leader peptidase (prepilin peptidase)/N-methyltransferase
VDSRAVGSIETDRRRDAIPVAAAVAGCAALLLGVLAGAVPASSALAVALLLPAAVVDLRERRLPDVWVAAATVGFVGIGIVELLTGDGRTTPAVGSTLVGVAVFAGPLLVLHLIVPTAMGFGDVKTAAVLGAATGAVDWRLALVALTLAAGAAAAVGVGGRLRTVPLGPFLVGSGVVVLLTDHVWLADLAANGGVG